VANSLNCFIKFKRAHRNGQRLAGALDGMKGAGELFKLTRLCKIQSFITKDGFTRGRRN